MSISRVIYQISSTLQALVKVRKPSLQNVPHKWPDLLHIMENYTPPLKVTKFLWEVPSQGWIKVNIDGNPGRSSIGFVLRDEEGDVRFAMGKEIQEVTNTDAETRAILEVLKYFIQHSCTQI